MKDTVMGILRRLLTTFCVIAPLVFLVAAARPWSGCAACHRVWPACRVELYSEPAARVLHTAQPRGWTFRYAGDHWRDVHGTLLEAAEARFLRSMEGIVPKEGADDDYPINPGRKDLRPLEGVRVEISSSVSDLRHEVDESYELEIHPVIDNDGYISLNAQTVFGVLRGFQTLLQLFEFGWTDRSDGSSRAVFVLRDTPIQILDGPAYPYRGLLIDTSRHYLPLDLILHNLDAMEMNKLNVLHWHLTDDQAWPYESKAFPDLSKKGAYCRRCTYSGQDIKLVVQEAALRGIRVVLEVDLPGHSQAIGASHPELLTDCGASGPSAPLDATNLLVYEFVHRLYSEINEFVFDKWIHIGGDEVSLACWKNSSKIQAWMKDRNMTDELELLAFFEADLLNYTVTKLGKTPVVWQELFDLDFDLPEETVVDVWKEWDLSTRANASKRHRVLLSACWYLDHLGEDWMSFYQCDPRDFNGTRAQKRRIVGGHASMWGERVDEANFLPRVWPRASAMAERLWTGNSASASATAQSRLESFRCRMVRLGFPASPISPGSCEHSKDPSTRRPDTVAAAT